MFSNHLNIAIRNFDQHKGHSVRFVRYSVSIISGDDTPFQEDKFVSTREAALKNRVKSS